MTRNISILVLRSIIYIITILSVSSIFVHFNATVEDVQSQSFRDRAERNRAAVIACLSKGRETNTSLIEYLNKIRFPEDAEHHFEEIKNASKMFYERDPHYYASYDGPWIENHWIESFSSLPLSSFGGMIPIFAQWVDSEVNDNSHEKQKYRNKVLEFIKLLRPDVLYVTLTQNDLGLGDLPQLFPNILMLSAGGYGNVPLPLLKRPIDHVPVRSLKFEYSFSGNLRKNIAIGHRAEILQKFEDWCQENKKPCVIQGYGKRWYDLLLETKFNLAPRGFGRASFRFTEIIQSGRVPVFLHDDGLPWIPYFGTNISVEQFGYVGILFHNEQSVDNAILQIQNATTEELERKLQLVKEVHEYYTYEGVMKQIAALFSDPFGTDGGYLRCMPLPSTNHR